MDSSSSRKKKTQQKTPSPRRDGREAAVQFLYGTKIQKELEITDEQLDEFWELRSAKPFAREFAAELVKGIAEELPLVDEAIRDSLENYSFGRLANVDRNILRLGAYEILFADHIPAQAAINEAIEVAKRLGNEDSPAFINGILDRILQTHSAD